MCGTFKKSRTTIGRPKKGEKWKKNYRNYIKNV